MNPQKKMNESSSLLLNDEYEQKERNDSVSSSFSLSFLRKTMIATIFAVVSVFVIMTKTNQLRVQENPIAVASGLGWKDDVHFKWEEFQHKYVIIEDDNSYSEHNVDDEGIFSLGDDADGVSSVPDDDEGVSSVPVGLSNFLYLNESRSFLMLGDNDDFYYYQQGWETQMNQAYCSVATMAAVLNSLRGDGTSFELPMDPTYDPFYWATQRTIVDSKHNDCVSNALGGKYSAESVKHIGLGIGKVPEIMNCYLNSNGYIAIPYPANSTTEVEANDLKNIIVDALLDEKSRVVLNYDRGGIGQGPIGHGHWSPLGGYNKETDSFLIMDVAKYKHPPAWVKWMNLFDGVSTKDTCTKLLSLDTPIDWNNMDFTTILSIIDPLCIPGYRGFVVVKPKDMEDE